MVCMLSIFCVFKQTLLLGRPRHIGYSFSKALAGERQERVQGECEYQCYLVPDLQAAISLLNNLGSEGSRP